MKDTGLVTCQRCHARFDEDFGKCWKCGTRSGEPKPDDAKQNQTDQITQQSSPILILTLVLISLGLCLNAPGLLIPFSVVFAILFLSQNSSGANRKSGQPARSLSPLHVIGQIIAVLVLLPICIGVGFLIICGGFVTVACMPALLSPGSWGEGPIVVCVIVLFLVAAVALLWGLLKVLGRVLRP